VQALLVVLIAAVFWIQRNPRRFRLGRIASQR